MDPISTSIILAVSKLSESVVRDAYDGLKALLARKFGARSGVSQAVDAIEVKPESAGRQAVLVEEVGAAGVAGDKDVLAALAALQAALESVAAREGGGQQRTAIRQQAGDHATQIGQVQGNVTFHQK